MKVSVLVPVYNSSRYLVRCLDSLCGQTLKGIEIIFINDGSKDESLQMLEQYASAHDNIRILDKSNSGYGDSLNRGMELATGEFIGIIEPDDFVEKSMFERLYGIASDHGVDVVKSSFNKYWSSGKVKYHHLSHDKSLFNRKLKPTEHYSIFKMSPSIWSAIYRREFLLKNKILFLNTPGASYQDTSFNFKIWACAESVYLVKDALVYYRQDNSASSVHCRKNVFAVCAEFNEIERFIKESGRSELWTTYQEQRVAGYLWNFARLSPENRKLFLRKIFHTFKEASDSLLKEKIRVTDSQRKRLLKAVRNSRMFLWQYRWKDFKRNIKNRFLLR